MISLENEIKNAMNTYKKDDRVIKDLLKKKKLSKNS